MRTLGGLLRIFGVLQEEGGEWPFRADGSPPCWGTTAAGKADLMGRCVDQDMVGAGGGPGPDTRQLGVLGQVTALLKHQCPHEMNPLTPGLAPSGDHCEKGQESL